MPTFYTNLRVALPPTELMKAIMLAAAFLFWAANQFWPNLPLAILFNDIAIALFVLDVFLGMIGWPATSPDEAFAETYVDPSDEPGDQSRASIQRTDANPGH